MIEFFLNVDNLITNFIIWIIPRNQFIDYFFLGITFDWLILLIGIIFFLLLWHFESTHTKQYAIYFVISYFIISFFVNIVIKNTIQRERPYVINQIETVYCPSTFSFPSGHATSAFIGAVIFSYYDKKRKWFYYSLAIFISISRIYLHCHYFFDVFIGAFLGYVLTKMILLNISDNSTD
ncbi:MAG TPA: phosphatase PAP2 family protein [Candidatus Woesebacteria bacterium]|nr:phosphatase PAP2 family protein [Candidatus Woesebacteria bacterium]